MDTSAMPKNAICLCVDRRMAIPAIFLACSIREYSQNPRNDYDIVIVTPPGALDRTSREFIEARGVKIDESISLDSIEDIKIAPGRLSHSTLLRLFLADHYKNLYDKIIYLDVDLTIHEDVSRLFSIELGEYAVAAVPAPLVLSDRSYREVDRILFHFTDLGMIPPYRFFNSGVMLIDPRNWVDSRITERALEFIRKNPQLCSLPDEDALNAVLDGHILGLSPIWNMRPERLWARNVAPAIIHYAGPNKPWKRFDRYEKLAVHRSAYAEYHRFLRNTPWRGFLRSQWGPKDLFDSFLAKPGRAIQSIIGKVSKGRSWRRRDFARQIKLCDEMTSFVDIEQGVATRRGDFISCPTD